MIEQERLKELLYYHPESGDWVWLVVQGRSKVGMQAGVYHAGYIRIKIDGKSYLGHRLAHLYVEGAFPENDVDHENLDRGDSRWGNIRKATRAQNRANTTCRNALGIKGVYRHGFQIKANKKTKYLGLFESKEAAALAYHEAAQQHFGDFARP